MEIQQLQKELSKNLFFYKNNLRITCRIETYKCDMLKWLAKHQLFDFNEVKQKTMIEKEYNNLVLLQQQSNQNLLLNNYVRFYFLFIQFIARSGLNDIKIDSFDWTDDASSLYNNIPEIFKNKKYNFDNAMGYFVSKVLVKVDSVENLVKKAENKGLDISLSKLSKTQQKKDEI